MEEQMTFIHNMNCDMNSSQYEICSILQSAFLSNYIHMKMQHFHYKEIYEYTKVSME